MRKLSWLKVITGVLVITGLTGCAHTNKPIIPAFSNQNQQFQINDIRTTAIKETARSIGAQAGLAWISDKTNYILGLQQPLLGQTFNFQALMLDNDVVPPILEESNNTLDLDNGSTIRLADKTYEIIQPAHFSTTVPSWRDYLWMGFTKPEAPDDTLLPKSNDERDLWNRNITIGWNEGIKQGREIFALNLSKLVRDYQGMILYHKLYIQKMVTKPYVSKASLGITGGGNNLRVNDRILRITAIPQLKTDSKTWQPRMFSQYYYVNKPIAPTVYTQKTIKPTKLTVKSKKKVQRTIKQKQSKKTALNNKQPKCAYVGNKKCVFVGNKELKNDKRK